MVYKIPHGKNNIIDVKCLYTYRILLSLGYSERLSLAAIKILGCNQITLMICSRCIHTPELDSEILRKIVSNVKGRTLIIDGYNQAATYYAGIQGQLILRCTDGMVRDFLGGSYDRGKSLQEMAKALSQALERGIINPTKIIMVLDSRVPHSAKHRILVLNMLKNSHVDADVILSRNCDKTIITLAEQEDGVVASSDIVIAKKTKRVIDLAAKILNDIHGIKAKDISTLLGIIHKDWCKEGP